MKKIIFAAFLTILSLSSFCQNLDLIINDLSIFFEELEKEMVPHTLQNELSGYGIGEADFDDKRLFFFSASIGANLTSGLFKFIDKENSYFEYLNVYNFMDSIVQETPDFIQDGYKTAQSFMPYFNLRMGAGFNFFFDTDVIILFSIFPGFFADVIGGWIDQENFELNSINIGIRIRKVLLKDNGLFPAISLGIGYTFANFHLGYGVPKFEQDLGGDQLIISGNLYLESFMHAAGIDFAISKRFSFFIPFLKVSAYYQWTQFGGGMNDFNARIENTVGTVIAETDNGPESIVKMSELSIILNGGFEIKLGGFALIPYSTFHTTTGSFTVNLETRTEF
ncbi:MAG: hypothetical protein JXB88_14605 [Spirochaetales bacterium]|nr:hypothetical protein [Spirochaetales bacterium]